MTIKESMPTTSGTRDKTLRMSALEATKPVTCEKFQLLSAGKFVTDRKRELTCQ